MFSTCRHNLRCVQHGQERAASDVPQWRPSSLMTAIVLPDVQTIESAASDPDFVAFLRGHTRRRSLGVRCPHPLGRLQLGAPEAARLRPRVDASRLGPPLTLNERYWPPTHIINRSRFARRNSRSADCAGGEYRRMSLHSAPLGPTISSHARSCGIGEVSVRVTLGLARRRVKVYSSVCRQAPNPAASSAARRSRPQLRTSAPCTTWADAASTLVRHWWGKR